MSTIYKTTVSLILILFIAVTAIMMIGADNDVKQADAYLAHCSAELQVCNFNDAIISQFETEAAENGYILEITKMTDANGDVLYAVAKMEYTYKVPIIGIESTHTKTRIIK